MIFSRSRGSGRHAKVDEGRVGRHTGRRGTTDAADDGEVDGFDDADAAGSTGGRRSADRGGGDAVFGPFDVADAPDGIAQLDLGALRVPAVEGVEVRVQADPDGKIQQVVLAHGESALQLGAFAAPRNDGIWDEVRAEIRKQLFTDGVAAEEVDGDYGTELRARVRNQEGLTDIRFVGVDGPRWLVRAVYQGPAAIDPTVAPALVECLRNLVVDRGQEAMPAREPLPLRLPREMVEQGVGEAQAASDQRRIADESAGVPAAGRKPSPRPRRR